MPETSVVDTLERLAETLVFCDATDMPALAELHGGFTAVADSAKGSFPETVALAATAVAGIIEKIILEEMNDPKGALDVTVSGALAALQAVVRDGRDPAEVDFPPALGLAKSEPAAAPAQSASSEPAREVDTVPKLAHPTSLPAHIDAAIFADFLSRQGSVLDEFEALALEIEKRPDQESLDALRRVLHSLKGESAMLGLGDVELACHTAEDAISSGLTPPVDALLALKDWLAKAFASYAGQAPNPGSVTPVLRRLTPSATPAEPPAAPEPEPEQHVSVSKPLEGDLGLMGDFVTEAREHLEAADVSLLTLETDPKNDEAINAVFRAFHTIKGVAGFLALDDIKSCAHEAENLLDKVRKGELELVGPVVDVTFDAVDALKRLVGHVANALASGAHLQVEPTLPSLISTIRAVASGDTSVVTERSLPTPPQPGKKLGEILVESGIASKKSVEEALSHQHVPAEKKKLGDILVEENLATRSEINAALELSQQPEAKNKVGEALVALGTVNPADVGAALEAQENQGPPKLGELLVRSGQAEARDVALALRSQQAAQAPPAQAVQVKEAVKVDADRLDRLLDTIGELVIAESMVCQSQELQEGITPQLARQLAQLDKITRELQEMGTSLRMVPVRTTFQKMARLVRDLAKKSGKQVEFVMTGEDTELDKTVVDKISDPLVHMVRNSVDHGLESSVDERRASGKPETGRVELRAFHKGGNIYIEIEDDGRGLNRDAIIAKGIERGLIKDSDQLSDREIYNLIFEPGFSTAKKITDVSGRGVGMDVVKRNIESLRGQIEILSTPGQGSRFSIRLPLTLAIIDGMVVRAGSERYIIPTLSIIRSIRPEPGDIASVVKRGEMLKLQDRLAPLFRLNRLYDIADAIQDPADAVIVVVEDEGHQVGIMLDELLGQQQIVIKPLGELMQGIPGVSGGAVMPDGSVGLILDVGGLVKLANTDSAETPPESN